MNTETIQNTTATDERAALLAQLETTNATIADMEAEINQLRPMNDWQPGSPHGVNNPRLGDLLRDVGDMQAKAEALQEQIDRLDKIAAYQEAVANSTKNAKATHQRLVDIEQRIAVADKKAATVKQRATDMQNQVQQAEDAAKAAEAEAVRAYASAVASGDAKTEKAAHAKVQEVQIAVTVVQTQNAKNLTVIDALNIEAVALEEQINALKTERDELRRQLFYLIRVRLGDRWDRAVNDLVAIAASLAAADVLAGRSSSELSRLHLPLVADSSYQDFYSIRKQARTISDAELLKVMGVI